MLCSTAHVVLKRQLTAARLALHWILDIDANMPSTVWTISWCFAGRINAAALSLQ